MVGMLFLRPIKALIQTNSSNHFLTKMTKIIDWLYSIQNDRGTSGHTPEIDIFCGKPIVHCISAL